MYVKILKVKGEGMYRGLWGFMIFLLFFGCSSKKEKALMQDYNEKKTYFKTLQKTEKIILSENNITKVVLTATYLYNKNAKKSAKKNESFIVGLYFEDEEVGALSEIYGIGEMDENTSKKTKADEEVGALSEIYGIRKMDDNTSKKTKVTVISKKDKKIITEYALKLNGNKAISIEKLDLNDERLKGITLVTKWSTYALVQFKYEKNKHLEMVFESPLYGRGRASFSKVAKFVFMKRVF